MTEQTRTDRPPKARHDETVAYRDEVIPGSSIDVERWEWWSYTDAGEVDYYAQGTCPACHAEIQGSYADIAGPIEGQGRRGKKPAAPEATLPEVEIPLRCLCGADHGHAAAGGCGRRWSIVVPRAAP
jgi:hypothetical protein